MTEYFDIIGAIEDGVITLLKGIYPEWYVITMPDDGQIPLPNANGTVALRFESLIPLGRDGIGRGQGFEVRYKATIATQNLRRKDKGGLTSVLSGLLAILYIGDLRIDQIGAEFEVEHEGVNFASFEDGVWIYESPLKIQMYVRPEMLWTPKA